VIPSLFSLYFFSCFVVEGNGVIYPPSFFTHSFLPFPSTCFKTIPPLSYLPYQHSYTHKTYRGRSPMVPTDSLHTHAYTRVVRGLV
jgi:hypothetical protein